MLIALIADTHLPRGSRRLAPECVAVLERADLIVHAGDVTTADALAELERLSPVQAVHGNMDEAALRSSLRERLVVEAEGIRIGVVHDPGVREGRAARLAAAFPGCDAVAYGHTHLPELTRHGSVWILNPGSPTERRGAPHRSLMTLELEDGELRPRLIPLP
jgi:putative phosphoesterase